MRSPLLTRPALRYFILATFLVASIPIIYFIFPHNDLDDRHPFLSSQMSPSSSDTMTTSSTTSTRLDTSRTLSPSPPAIDQDGKENVSLGLNSGNRKVHVFYYPWYATPEHGGSYNHWDHEILPHWNAEIKKQHPYGIKYQPPEDIGSPFYPLMGPYSSSDPKVIDEHMKELKDYVVVVSWWGPGNRSESADSQGAVTDKLMPSLFKAAERFGTQLAVHLEPYPQRSEVTVREDLQYLIDTYGGSPSFYREEKTKLPVVYLYDSYLTKPESWRKILDPQSPSTIRNTAIDAVMLGLYVNHDSQDQLKNGLFDGFYTYFAADGFTKGSTMSEWHVVSSFATRNNMILSISVGPGYEDSRIRPWNTQNSRSRQGGKYYDAHWQAALDLKPAFISITSFNEWLEGTQIEPVIPKTIPTTIFNGKSFKYMDYGNLGPNYYLERTHYWASQF